MRSSARAWLNFLHMDDDTKKALTTERDAIKARIEGAKGSEKTALQISHGERLKHLEERLKPETPPVG